MRFLDAREMIDLKVSLNIRYWSDVAVITSMLAVTTIWYLLGGWSDGFVLMEVLVGAVLASYVRIRRQTAAGDANASDQDST